MKKRWVLAVVLGAILCAGAALAQEQQGFWHSDRSGIYGREVMTPEERRDYRQKMWEFTTETERERYLDDHRYRMDARARARGITLSGDMPTEEAEEAAKGWPDDGLRRWPEEPTRQNALRRWQPSRLEGGGGVRNWQTDRGGE
ncbi:MAG: hypothetical protein WDA20_08250 [Desulfuromonadales bacterium]